MSIHYQIRHWHERKRPRWELWKIDRRWLRAARYQLLGTFSSEPEAKAALKRFAKPYYSDIEYYDENGVELIRGGYG